jgi:hypothetical protein
MIRVVTALFLLGFTAFAGKPKAEQFQAPIEKVWPAAVQAASENFIVSFTDKESRIVTFESGASAMSKDGYKMTAVLTPSGEGTRIKS